MLRSMISKSIWSEASTRHPRLAMPHHDLTLTFVGCGSIPAAHGRAVRQPVGFFRGVRELGGHIGAGELRPHHLVCRWFFLRRSNVNWEGRQRSWTDNLLWHHACHVVDAALWLLGETEPESEGAVKAL